MKNGSFMAVVMTVELFVAVCLPVFAHHGKANYDVQHPITLFGTVTAYEFLNPHVLIRFDVADAKGATSKWVAEGDPPQKLYRAGWKRDSLKPGDQVTITGPPDMAGQHILVLQKLVGPGGTILAPAPDL